MKQRMTRILFVCHGNICRSPMAEFVMKDMVQKRGLNGNFFIESAATTNEELGNPVHRGTAHVLDGLGIDYSAKRARRITSPDYDAFDLIVGMDEENMRDMMRAFKNDPAGKVHKMLEFAEEPAARGGRVRDVADPWYTGNFDETYDDVRAGCTGILSWLGY